MKYDFIRKLSGKKYEADTVKNILASSGSSLRMSSAESVSVDVPYSKPDIALPADVVEEVMRIDGYDNILIPSSITISPSVGGANPVHIRKEKTADYLVGAGFSEIFTNSITNAAYFEDDQLANGVRLLNNLSAVHNIMRPSMLQTGLESVAYNINRKNNDLRLFEFGKTYQTNGVGKYYEAEHLSLFVSGNRNEGSWKEKAAASDIFYVKGVVEAVLSLTGLSVIFRGIATNCPD